MTRYIITLLSLLFSISVVGQQDYFQQEVNYRIEVMLNDTAHTLAGRIEIEYINNSSDRLRKLYFHLWPNAYKNNNTAFARQQLRMGKKRFYFAHERDRGFIDELDFQVDGQKVRWSLSPEHLDIAVISLKQALEPGDTARIHTPFTVRIPESFSRLGHIGQSYQITQWYPKPAVYDRNGWHPMPYLDIGEFYSEFGSFDVSITLPENYVVAATGLLQTESEREFLTSKVFETRQYLDQQLREDQNDEAPEDFPASAPQMKTIRYTAENVHDFAWFADKRFRVLKGEVGLASGRTVDTWALFTKTELNLWKDAIQYLDRSVAFYSGLVGEYPWPQATAVQSALSAGGGMEYPMITVIDLAGDASSLDLVITHEVGHNWFYGMLGTNERDHPWMDEGINTYYEHRYLEQYYQQDPFEFLPEFAFGDTEMDIYELGYLYQARRNLDQAPDQPADQFSELNYWLGAYEKPAMALRHLDAYLGRSRFDELMQSFFREWKFRHPQPADFRTHLEKESGKELSWLFDGFLYTNKKMDYALTGLETEGEEFLVSVRNKGAVPAPFTLSGVKDGQVIHTLGYEGFEGERQLRFPVGAFDRITLDAERMSLEVYRQNNHFRLRGALPRIEPFEFKMLGKIEDDRRSTLFWMPALGRNNYDKFMLGMALYNTTLPARRFEYVLTPMYAFGSKDLAGLGRLRYRLHTGGETVREIVFGLGLRRFHFFRNTDFDYRLRYQKLTPYAEVQLGNPGSNFSHQLTVRSIFLFQEEANFPEGVFEGTKVDRNIINELSYTGRDDKAPNPYQFRLALEQQHYDYFTGDQDYLKVSLEWKNEFAYLPESSFDLRIFAGGFLINSSRKAGRIAPGAFNLIALGEYDYRFDEHYFGRYEREGLWSQQLSLSDGGMKVPVNAGFNLGRSNNFILAMNFKADLPLISPVPLRPYFDIGYFDNAMPTGNQDSAGDQLLWSGGLMLDFFDGIAGVYFPLFNSKNIQDLFVMQGNYWNRISFHLDLQRLDPWRLREEIRRTF